MISICSNKRPHPFPRGDDSEIVKISYQHLRIFFSRTTGLISTKFGTKHPWVKGIQVYTTSLKWKIVVKIHPNLAPSLQQPWVKGIQVCSNEGPHPFPRGDNIDISLLSYSQLCSRKYFTGEPYILPIDLLFSLCS